MNVNSPLPARLKAFLRKNWTWVLLGVTILMIFSIRIRLREMPLERDEGEYAYAGQLMMQGVPPYQEAFNMKLPGTYAAYAVIMAIFGQTPAGIHIGLALVNSASIALMFLVARRILNDVGAIASAIAFALLSTNPSVLGLAAHATHFVVLFALAGLLMILRPGNLGSIALSGVFFGLAFVMKQHGIFFGIFGGLFLLYEPGQKWVARRSKPRYAQKKSSRHPEVEEAKNPRFRTVKTVACYAGAFLLPYLAISLSLAAVGAFRPFWFWTVSYAAKYAFSMPLVAAPELLRGGVRAVVGPNIVLWTLPWLGAVLIWWDRRLDRRKRFFLMALLFCSMASVSLGFYFREHYFILLLPALCLLSGAAFSRGIYLLRHDRTIELFLAIPIMGLFLIAVGAAIVGNGPIWFGLSPENAARRIYGTSLFSEAKRLGEYLRTLSDPKTRIAVLGSEPEIFFYSHRRSVSGYIYMYPLMEPQTFAHKMQEDLIREIEKTQPDYVVYVDDRYSWLPHLNSEHAIINWWPNYRSRSLEALKFFSYREGEGESAGEAHALFDAPVIEGEACQLLLFKTHRGNVGGNGSLH